MDLDKFVKEFLLLFLLFPLRKIFLLFRTEEIFFPSFVEKKRKKKEKEKFFNILHGRMDEREIFNFPINCFHSKLINLNISFVLPLQDASLLLVYLSFLSPVNFYLICLHFI